MNILVVGGGGREHALIKKLKESPEIETIYALPGNGGIAQDAVCIPKKAADLEAICAVAKEKNVGFAVVAPDDPLVLGAVDRLEAMGIPCFGPRANAAIIEGSKVFSKELMRKYGIPTAWYEIFDCPEAARAYLKTVRYPIVVKADGLALGKGVLICETVEQADAAIREIMEDRVFGKSGARVVVEEFLTGPEVSVLAFTDGKTMIPMVSSMDHKRAKDGDQGLNTGGMGTIAPNPCYTKEIARRCMQEIFLPTMEAMNKEGRTFRGCLYFGLMLTAEGPKVIEYNCRFGDPETQVVLPLLKSDLFTILRAVSEGRLAEVPVEFYEGAACCVVVAKEGYPEGYTKGAPIEIGELPENVEVYHAGVEEKNGQLVSAGGRILGVTARADTLQNAINLAYEGVLKVQIEGSFYRRDIGQRALREGGR